MIFDSRIHIMWPFMLVLHASFSQPFTDTCTSACWHYPCWVVIKIGHLTVCVRYSTAFPYLSL